MPYTAKEKDFIHRVFGNTYESLVEGLSSSESEDFNKMLDELITPVEAIDDLDRFIEPLA